MIVHVECIYGFYHGQDPRTFSPDEESCTAEEIAKHKQACDQAEKGEWSDDGESGCRITPGARAIVCSAGLGIGTYHVVMNDEDEYVRDATYEDYSREAEQWEETSVAGEDGSGDATTALAESSRAAEASSQSKKDSEGLTSSVEGQRAAVDGAGSGV